MQNLRRKKETSTRDKTLLIMDYSFNYDNIKIEFSLDKNKIKADGAFFKSGFMTHKEVIEYIEKLNDLKVMNNFESEMQRKSNEYFLGLLNRLDNEFHVSKLKIQNK